MSKLRVALIGARGHVGVELIPLLAGHPQLELACVGSRELAGQAVAGHVHGYRGDLPYEHPDPQTIGARAFDIVVLALPNGHAHGWVEAIEARSPGTLILDLSADHRFDAGWYYALPELTRANYSGQRRLSLPGCFATAMQLAIAPMCDLLDGPVQCFGVSGYSGAGTAPSPRNDADTLRDGLLPYSLTGHLHEREVAAQLGQAIEFMPHVAPHFRGLSMTGNLHLRDATSGAQVLERYRRHYRDEPLVHVTDAVPNLNAVAGRHNAVVGGFALSEDGKRLVVVCVLDNLLKGAATQALQALNLACDFEETLGIPLETAA